MQQQKDTLKILHFALFHSFLVSRFSPFFSFLFFFFGKTNRHIKNSSFSRSSHSLVTYSASLRRKGGVSSISRDFLSKVSSAKVVVVCFLRRSGVVFEIVVVLGQQQQRERKDDER